MKKEFMYLVLAIWVVIAAASCDPSDPGKNNVTSYPEELDRLVPGASVIVKGKVLVLNTSLTDEEDVSNLGVVQVTEVVDAPEHLKALASEQITVRFADMGKVREGEERLFFTEPYWVGEFLGVEEKGSLGSDSKLFASKELARDIQSARKAGMDRDLAARMKAAPAVVSGKVLRVDQGKGREGIISEHDPEWQVAEIEVAEPLVGGQSGTIKVLFAASKDVMFEDSPKLKEGDDGIFILEKAGEVDQKLTGVDLKVTEQGSYVRGMKEVDRYKGLLK